MRVQSSRRMLPQAGHAEGLPVCRGVAAASFMQVYVGVVRHAQVSGVDIAAAVIVVL